MNGTQTQHQTFTDIKPTSRSYNEENTINGLLKDLEPIIQKLNDYLKPLNINYQKIKWDLANAEDKLFKVADKIKAAEQTLADVEKQGQGIIADAKLEGDRILATARTRNLASLDLLKKIEEFVSKEERKNFHKLKTEAEELG